MVRSEIEYIFNIKDGNPDKLASKLVDEFGYDTDDININKESNSISILLPYPYEDNIDKLIDISDEFDIDIETKDKFFDTKWEKNMIRDENGNIDVKWNHKIIFFDKAIEKAVKNNRLDLTKGENATDIKIFQLDTGKSDHPRLKNYPRYNTQLAKNFFRVGNENDGDDYRGFPQGPGHSTSTGFTIVGTKGLEEVFNPDDRDNKKLNQELNEGLFPYVEFVPIRISRSVLLTRKTLESMYEGVKYAIDKGADIIAMSMAGFGFSKYYEKAVNLAYDKGVIFVCAAGSEVDFISDVMKPASMDKTIGVGGISTQKSKKKFELIPLPRGNDGITLDISAPAKWVYTAGSDKDENYHRLGIGTSQSAAHVAAAAALWKHYWKEELKGFKNTPYKIVEAFKWAVKKSMYKPKNWSDIDLRESKGILNVDKLLDFHPLNYQTIVQKTSWITRIHVFLKKLFAKLKR